MASLASYDLSFARELYQGLRLLAFLLQVEAKEHQLKSRRKYPHTIGDRLFRREMSNIKYPSSTFSKVSTTHYDQFIDRLSVESSI